MHNAPFLNKSSDTSISNSPSDSCSQSTSPASTDIPPYRFPKKIYHPNNDHSIPINIQYRYTSRKKYHSKSLGDQTMNQIAENNNNQILDRQSGINQKYDSRCYSDGSPQRDNPQNVSTFGSPPSYSDDQNSFDESSIIQTYQYPMKYNAILRSKGSGIIPYAIVNDIVYFLLQHADIPCKKKEFGWNDFGGKQNNPNESTYEVAAREFSEETSCLFYLKENSNPQNDNLYGRLRNNDETRQNYSKIDESPLWGDEQTIKNPTIDEQTITDLINTIPLAQHFYSKRINEYMSPLYISSKETYISYLVRVEYIPAKDIPKSEDLHIPYTDRYTRICKWFTFNELMEFNNLQFHKRLQITKIKQRIKIYYERKLFT